MSAIFGPKLGPMPTADGLVVKDVSVPDRNPEREWTLSLDQVDGDITNGSKSLCTMRTGVSCRALKHAVSSLNRLDDFIMEKIGAGFFSEVFKVTHRVTGKVMALKMNLLRSNQRNMLKEVQLMNRLNHDNILRFKGVCVHQGQLHALTEFINGGSLEQLIQNVKIDVTDLTKLHLARDVAKGMEYLHSRGYFHRDLTSKNVLIKYVDNCVSQAIVGDFGLSTKIPDSPSRKLETVGSPYWTSPECLKGKYYDESSDVFSYGIILCELIARIGADPDILPRTNNFGLDYLAFTEICGPNVIPDFLKTAFCCCTVDPKSRPNFVEIVRKLSQIIIELEMSKTILKRQSVDNLLISAGQKSASKIGEEMNSYVTKSVEVLPIVNIESNHKTNDFSTKVLRKYSHRRSLSEELGCFGLSQHSISPSDKARCHILLRNHNSFNSNAYLTAKKIGEIMCLEDPDYTPRTMNPFTTLVQFQGATKILGNNSPKQFQNRKESEPITPNEANSSSSTLLYNSGSSDLFSSCFELPSPSSFLQKQQKSSLDVSISPNAPSAKKQPSNKHILKSNLLLAHPLFIRQQQQQPKKINSNNNNNTTFYKCCSSTNLSSGEIETSWVRRRGSSESGFFSSIGEDYYYHSDLYQHWQRHQHNISDRNRYRNISSATLNSSSATTSSMFLNEDLSQLNSSSHIIRSVDDLELLNVDFRRRLESRLKCYYCCSEIMQKFTPPDLSVHHKMPSFLLNHHNCYQRTSSIYTTDSSEDVSSSSWGTSSDERFLCSKNQIVTRARPTNHPRCRQSQQIAKIVEYFERKGNSSKKDSVRWKNGADNRPFHINELQAKMLIFENKNSAISTDCGRGTVGEKNSTIKLNSKIAALRYNLERQQPQQQSQSQPHFSPCLHQLTSPASSTVANNRKTIGSQRLTICEGAVRSKLPLFDRRQPQ